MIFRLFRIFETRNFDNIDLFWWRFERPITDLGFFSWFTYFLIFLAFLRFPLPTKHNIFDKNTKHNVSLSKSDSSKCLYQYEKGFDLGHRWIATKKGVQKNCFIRLLIEIFQISNGNDAEIQFRKSLDFARLNQTFWLADKMRPSDWLTN